MFYPVIDSHIHLLDYKEEDRTQILEELEMYQVQQLISISNNLKGAKENISLSSEKRRVKPVVGFHPEQQIEKDSLVEDILSFIEKKQHHLVAIGEIGLPYYLRKENPELSLQPYINLLEAFIKQASNLKKPVVLHAIYEDAPIVCELLEKYTIKKAHFHWFKGDKQTIARIIRNGYYVSVTPDIMYKERARKLVEKMPIDQLMVETDGPWPFEGLYEGKLTHPKMLHNSIKVIAKIKQIPLTVAYNVIYENTKHFYNL
mgnify:CR=1 FL=1